MVQIRTGRLLLRPARLSDTAGFHAILSDERAMAWWSTEPHGDVDTTRAWVEAMVAIDPAEGEDFVIEQDGRLIGKAGFFRFREIGFILHPDAWGNGYAREALLAVLQRAFAVHRLPAVEADVDPHNAASLGLLSRLGFRETGRARNTWHVAGKWCDSVYLRLESDWLVPD